MQGSKDLLTSVMKTAQKGQSAIQSALKSPLNASLRAALQGQLREYGDIEQEAQSIAQARGWTLEELDPAVKSMSSMMARIQLSFGDTDYKAVSLTIQGNTKGMIRGLHGLRQLDRADERVAQLSQKLLDCETANIRQMQGYL